MPVVPRISLTFSVSPPNGLSQPKEEMGGNRPSIAQIAYIQETGQYKTEESH